jgi:pimeloyl-ACP methyl ester carboxylesterase
LWEEIRGSRLELIPEAGHFVQEDASKEVAQGLVAFLSEDEERV